MTEPALSAPINATCPWSGDPVRPDSLTRYRGHSVGFCNPGCRDKFATAVAQFDAIIAGEAGPTLLRRADLDPTPARLAEAALVIIDAQEEYRSGALPLSGIEAAVERLGALLAAARAAGSPVIHVVHRGRAGGLFDLAGPGGAILAELRPVPGEAVIEKDLPSAFAGTSLHEQLRAAGRPDLLLAGFMTHMCVSTTARAALDLGHRVTLAADATATRALPDPLGGPALAAAEVQRAALASLADRFAIVVPTAALLPA
ncbi:Isochorismatase [Rhodovastum atsumiense]|uniref:cysteine hydrolase family protein n=1 Tax=Rhodovastum atsumiense TaxID=504468 RepID=UPI0020592681|nr:Isochorismatase [Rhodovastum atsumiense]